MGSDPKRIQVLLPLPLSGPFDYLMEADTNLAEGDFVMVPLGSRTLQGVVWTMEPEKSDVAKDKLKPVMGKLDLPALPHSLRRFIDWVARYNLSPPGAVLKMAVTVPRAFDQPKKKTLYRLSSPLPEKLTDGRRAVVAAAIEDMPMSLKVWAELAAVGEGVLRGMVKAGQMVTVEVRGEDPYPEPDGKLAGPALSPEQHKAARHLREMVSANIFKPVLLEGITGSGKTEVYFEAIAEALKTAGSQILVLVPEIALTTQWLARFEERFGAAPVVWHSDLTKVQRRRAWWAAIGGKTRARARVIVGARSALFLPFQDLKLIVVDEEHSATFKQEDGVFYQGRDMAVVRAMQANCPVILASATPSLETVLNGEGGKYDWLYLGERHGAALLPDMKVIDLRHHKLQPGKTWLSEPLRAALSHNLEKEEQSLLYLNRRGYAPLTLCRSCGHRMECPHCKAWLVEHRKGGRLICHHCGFSCALPRICPECDAEDSMTACGPGVERVAEEAQALFPDARIVIMASDEISGPAEMRAMITRIERHEVDIIIGTQIVTKGYHFPLLTLVGVVDADLGLGGGDPRAAERTWQQLEQVAGRAGRAERPGRVLFQTYAPDHPVLLALISGDGQEFLLQEARMREQQMLPPFGKLAAIIISGKNFNAVVKSARRLAAHAPKDDKITILGPVPAPMAYLRGNHRFRLLVKAEKSVRLQNILGEWLRHSPPDRGVVLQVDIDPYSFF